MKLYRLNSTVLSFRNNPVSFLNGLTSNDMAAPQNVFLNLHGRIIATFDQVKMSDDEIWIVVANSAVEPLAQHLDRYLKLAGVAMEILDRKVYFCLSSPNVSVGDPKNGFPTTNEECPARGPKTFGNDSENKDVIIPQKAGRLILSTKNYPSNVSEEEFRLFRLKSHIPLHGVDYTDEMILNVGYEFVSFTKGCYLGQEFVSKVHNRSKPTWKLIVKAEEECSEEEKAKLTSKAFDPQTAKMLGFVFVRNE